MNGWSEVLIISSKNPYREWLKQDFGSLIDSLEITDQQRHFRWRHYRSAVDCLKIEGWQFFHLKDQIGTQ